MSDESNPQAQHPVPGELASLPPGKDQPQDRFAETRTETLSWAGLRRKTSSIWPNLVIILLVIAVGLFVAYDHLRPRTHITIWFDDIHGLNVGSPLEHGGEQIGQIVEISRSADLARRKVVVELNDDAVIVDRLRRQGDSFYISRFASDRLQIKGITRVIRGPSIIARLGDPSAPFQETFEGSAGMPPDPRLAWNSVRSSVYFSQIHGLSESALVMDRGQEVGVVETIEFAAASDRVRVGLAFFEHDANKCPYVFEQTRFYINKAKLSTRGLEGDASTLLYGAYVVAIPDPYVSKPKLSLAFQGEQEPPPEHLPRKGEQQLVLETSSWLPANTPLFYRGDLAGYVHSLRQPPGSASIQVVVRIYPEFLTHVRDSSVFFLQPKFKVQLFKARDVLDWEGPRLEIPDPQLLLRPAIEFRNPASGRPVKFEPASKLSFTLHAEPKAEWLKWTH